MDVIRTIDVGPHRWPVKVIRCDCGCEIELWSGWANACDRCPAEFNGSGQRLAPREFWGEETGEQF